MFCNQCEQTINGTACTAGGVCGKATTTSDLQDAIVLAARELSLAALAARARDVTDPEADRLCVKALFSTLTNVTFDNVALEELLRAVRQTTARLAGRAGDAAGKAAQPGEDAGRALSGISSSLADIDPDPDCASLRQTLLFGLKGAAAYMDHAAALGVADCELYARFHGLLAAGYDGRTRALGDWVEEALACGRVNLRAMELLDAANTAAYGHPEPTPVSLAPVPGKAILVSGHDLKDLHDLLVQTEGLGIAVYTHGEMLPAHGYPALRRFSHLAGHFGTAWQNQHREFVRFPGAILFTTNCLQRPAAEYAGNVFTTGLVGWPGLPHIRNGDFAPLIQKALALPGYTEEDRLGAEKKSVLTGFGRKTLLHAAPRLVEAAKSGALRRIYLVGGCDGARPGRNYYTEFVEKTPADTLVLTLACGKFRFFDKDLGTLSGIPRLLDVGQCNDAYAAVTVALALAEALKCGVNDLPLSLILSWYEQKAVAILLTLLALGVKNIRLGPSLPAFLSPGVLDYLVKEYAISPITTPDEDLAATLA